MRLTPEILREQNYTLIEKVEHDKFNAFLARQSWNSFTLKMVYFLSIFLFSILTIGIILKSNHPVLLRILFAGLGVLFALMVIPLHEFIHFLMYKYLGAANVKITSYLRQGYILTQANQFVVNKKDLLLVASAPFLILSAFGLILLFLPFSLLQIAISSMILFHATMCYSDFRIMDYFIKDKMQIFMYDDVEERASYFYKR